MLSKTSSPVTERRAYTRVETCQPVTVASLSSSMSQSAEIIDCSHDGLCLLLSSTIQKGQFVTIDRISAAAARRPSMFEVRWVLPSGDRFLAGVRRIVSG